MAFNGMLDRNLLALSTRHPELASRLSLSSARDDLSAGQSRTGRIVPVLRRDGREFPMHSRIDPEAEGIRIAAGAPSGFLVAFGLGAAYHLQPLIGRSTLTGLVIVESDLSLVRGLMEMADFSRLFSDSRVIMAADPTPESLVRLILDRYLPVLYGNLGSITLRSRWDAETEWFSRRVEALQGLPEALGRDYTVQTRFGRRWFVHTMFNLAQSERTAAVLPSCRRLLVTAAGPSLEMQIPLLKKAYGVGSTLLATDTSLPMLLREGLEPDIVLSIDCQSVSYHHFMAGLPKKTILVLDLASPPILTRLTDRILFFSSGHPFSLYLNRLYRQFPILDLSGGNVTHAALSLANLSGTRELHLFGADFSYPEGRPYARGTYIFPYFHSRASRTNGSDNLFWSFIRDSRPRRESADGTWRLRTSSMDHYRESLEQAITAADFQYVSVPGKGVPVTANQADIPKTSGGRTGSAGFVSAGPIRCVWSVFLKDYRRRLADLPPLNGPPQDYLEDLGTENRQAWATLLPAAATFRNTAADGPDAVERARHWTMERIDALLKRSTQFPR